MAAALITVAVAAAALWFASPLYGVVALILGILLAVGVVRGLDGGGPRR